MNITRTLGLTLLMAAPLLAAQAPAPAAAPSPDMIAQGGPPPMGPHGPMHSKGMPGEGHGFGSPDGFGFGAWWKNPETAKAINLTPDQQKKIDDLFTQSRVQLVDLHAQLEKEEILLGPLMDANPVDQGKAFAQISKIADTRAELEKANAKTLLAIRGVLSADQWTNLQLLHRLHHKMDDARKSFRGPQGPRSPQGSHGPRGPRGDGAAPAPASAPQQ